MNLLTFKKTNPNLTVIPFKENKCTSSETQTYEEGRKKKEKRIEKESYLDVKKEERKRKKEKEKEKRVTRLWRRKKEKGKKEEPEEWRTKKEKKRWVCGGRWESGDVGGKGGVRGKLENFFLGVTYSRVFKKKNCSYKLAIAAFLKSTTIGPPKKTDIRGKLQNFFFWCYL